MQELKLMAEADERARDYIAGIERRPPFPDHAARDGPAVFRKHSPTMGNGDMHLKNWSLI